jgi:hypothetical protein
MDTTKDDTVTKLLTLWKAGQPQAIGRLVEAVYDDLWRIYASWSCAGSIGGTAVISSPWRLL